MFQHSKYEADRVGIAPLGNGKNFSFITLLRNVFVYELSLFTLKKLFEILQRIIPLSEFFTYHLLLTYVTYVYYDYYHYYYYHC